ncbi:hypothetical protein Ais01nite_58880 [Asanoa ishikariensis]|nr:hypothetical protein Ais01nite_58880 [Asanoa ishikariensis]
MSLREQAEDGGLDGGGLADDGALDAGDEGGEQLRQGHGALWRSAGGGPARMARVGLARGWDGRNQPFDLTRAVA